MAIARPVLSEEIVPGRTLSHEDLCRTVNRQTAKIRELTFQKYQMMVYLCAMVRHPDAVSQDAAGRVWIEKRAIVEMPENTRIQTSPSPAGDKVMIKAFVSDHVLHAEGMRLGFTAEPLGG